MRIRDKHPGPATLLTHKKRILSVIFDLVRQSLEEESGGAWPAVELCPVGTEYPGSLSHRHCCCFSSCQDIRHCSSWKFVLFSFCFKEKVGKPDNNLDPVVLNLCLDQHRTAQCCGSVTFWYGSGSANSYHWLKDLLFSTVADKMATKFQSFFAYYFL